MTAKEFLRKGRQLNFEIDELKKVRDNAFTEACGTVTAISGFKVQTSNANTTEARFIKYADYTAMIDRRINELYQYQAEMMKVINTIGNTTYRTLLIAYYVNCKTWEETAEAISKSVRWTYMLHGEALKEVEKIL